MPKKSAEEDVQVLLDKVRDTYAELRRVLPEAIKAAQVEVDKANSKLVGLEEQLKMLPDIELARVSAKPERRAKIVKMAKKKAARLQSLGQQLKELRAASGLSQAAMARKSKVSQPTLCQAELDRIVPSENTLKKLAKAYKVPVASLKTPEGSPVN